MKLKILLCSLISCFATAQSVNLDRCPVLFTLANTEARKVLKWALTCNRIPPEARIYAEFSLKTADSSNLADANVRFLFPFWLNDAGNAWQGPADPQVRERMVADDCTLMAPAEYHKAIMCLSGCYAGDQRLLFPAEEVAKTRPTISDERFSWVSIQDAYMKVQKIFAVARGSTFESVRLKPVGVKSYMTDIADSEQSMLEFVTESGGKLKVTTNHPLLNSGGAVQQASQFKTGDLLVKQDGSFDKIETIKPYKFFGRVYNLDTDSPDLQEKLIVAEGFVNGTSYFQNEGLNKLNRMLMRSNLKLN